MVQIRCEGLSETTSLPHKVGEVSVHSTLYRPHLWDHIGYVVIEAIEKSQSLLCNKQSDFIKNIAKLLMKQRTVCYASYGTKKLINQIHFKYMK